MAVLADNASAELLSIAIPTRNRVGFLRDVLASLTHQVEQIGASPSQVRIYISDNASTDETPALISEFARLPHLVPSRNPENIGADRNFLKCIRMVQGRYCWLIGDDDIINPGAIQHVLGVLSNRAPGLLVTFDSDYSLKLNKPAWFDSFHDFATQCARVQPHALAQQTLITCNIFENAKFNQAVCEERMHTFYAHMYGLVKGLAAGGGGVYLSDFPVLTIRRQRAPAVDGVWPEAIEKQWHEYFSWLHHEIGVDELEPDSILRDARAAWWRRIRANPLKYVWDNLPSLVQPTAYRFVVKRLWYLLRAGERSRNKRPR